MPPAGTMTDVYTGASPHPAADAWSRILGGSVARPWLPLAAIALIAAFWGAAVALADLNAVFLCVSLIGCLFILFDFRIGVVLLIVLLPISRSAVFPHAMLGITGLNPLNLLLIGTLGSCLLQGLADGSARRFLPPALLLYLVPITIAGLLGARHVDEIVPAYYMDDFIFYDTAAGYLLETLMKPLMLVVFALLVGAALARSKQPERFLVPTLVSIWVMGGLVIIFVARSGVGLGELSASGSREFLTPLGMHANELGRLYATAYGLALFAWAAAKAPGLKLVLLATMALATGALLLTFSRGGFLGFIVINGLFLLWRLNAKTVVFAVVLGACALFAVPPEVYERATLGFGDGLNAITAGRYEGLWLPLLPELLRSPVWGNGLGSILWSDAMRSAGPGSTILLTTHPHNAYLEALLDMGVAGLVLILAYFAHAWTRFRQLGRDQALAPEMRGFYQGAAAALASLLIAAVADGSLAPKAEQSFIWLAIGMMYGQLARKAAGGADNGYLKMKGAS
jgi:O-antigen ligase